MGSLYTPMPRIRLPRENFNFQGFKEDAAGKLVTAIGTSRLGIFSVCLKNSDPIRANRTRWTVTIIGEPNDPPPTLNGHTGAPSQITEQKTKKPAGGAFP